jgi:hypothetical protein
MNALSFKWVRIAVLLSCVTAASCFVAISPAAAQSNYIAIRMGVGDNLTLRGVGDGQQVGDWWTPGGVSSTQAVLMTGTASSLVRLAPSSYFNSFMNDTAAGQQVGAVQLTSGSSHRAALWQGTADSFVDLQPAWASNAEAHATDGVQQVGGADNHAVLWTGSVASAVDLNPSGFSGSTASSVHNGVQAGYGDSHALMWRGTASSVVDLHPTGYSRSEVYGLGDGFQVGIGFRVADNTQRLLVWHGTAASVSDVTPSGITDFSLDDAAGPYMVGNAKPVGGTLAHAYVCSIDGETTDLHTTLPFPYSTRDSEATNLGVDALGNAVGSVSQSGVETEAVLWWRAGPLNSPTFTVGSDTFLQSVTIDTAKSMNISAVLTIAEGSSLVLDSANITAGTTKIKSGGTLSGHGTIQGTIVGDSGSQIVATGNLTLGDANAFNSFDSAGSLEVGSATVTLNSKGFATLGGLTTLSGGTLAAANGVSLGTGRNLTGSGAVNSAVAAGIGSTIEATGNLVLGDNNAYDGFFSDGRLYVGPHTVTIRSKNQAALGSLTTLEGGTLVVANGLSLDFAHNIVGNGVVESSNTLPKAVIINGNVEGTGAGLHFTGYVKGVGTFAGNIQFDGTYSPGLSPASVNLENMRLGTTSTLLMEIAGTAPGSQYDVVNISGTANLAGTLDVELLGGFMPKAGDTFDILNGDVNGRFSNLSLPSLSGGMSWDMSALYSNGVITVVPEPSTLALLGMGAFGLVVWFWRQKREAV